MARPRIIRGRWLLHQPLDTLSRKFSNSIKPNTQSRQMKTTTRLKSIHAVLLIAAVAMTMTLANRVHAAPVATSFTYQGALLSGGSAANGNYDLTFALFNDPIAGAQIGTTWTNLNVTVSNGLFTTTVDFGPGVFDGTAYWLSIGVRSNGAAVVFSTLSARQS